MSKPLPYLTDAQQRQVLAALATLRLSGHDRFLLDLASALAHCSTPVTDLDLRIAIRKLLGVVPVKDVVREGCAMNHYHHSEGTLLPLARRFPEELRPSSADKVRAFAEQMRAGIEFPPVRIVFGRDGLRFYIQDGMHRAVASLLCGFDLIPAVTNPNPWGFAANEGDA